MVSRGNRQALCNRSPLTPRRKSLKQENTGAIVTGAFGLFLKGMVNSLSAPLREVKEATIDQQRNFKELSKRSTVKILLLLILRPLQAVHSRTPMPVYSPQCLLGNVSMGSM